MAGGKIEIDVEPNLKGFDGKVERGLRSALGPVGNVSKGLGTAIAVGTGIAAAGLKVVIDKGIEYQSNLNNLQAVTGATGAQMSQVATVAKALGADLSLPATSAADAASAMLELAKSGLSVDQAMTAAKGTLELAAAAQIDAARAAEIQGNALNAFGLSADQAGHVADVLANTANAASGEITDMAEALKQAGTVSHQFGISIDETATALGLLANAGIRGSDAGTLLKTALTQLASPSKPAAAAMKDLGLKAFDASGKFVGLESVMSQLNAASGRMTDQQYAAATATLFGTDAVRLAGVAAQTSAADWDKMAASVSKAGGAQELAAAKTKGLGGAIEGFKSQLETVGLDIFDAISGPLEAGTKAATSIVTKLGPQVAAGVKNVVKEGERLGPGIAQAIQSKASEVAGVAQRLFTPIVDGAKRVVDSGIGIVRTAVDGFASTMKAAATAVQPVADGIGRLEKSAATASGPLGAVRFALELAYDAAKLVVQILSPLVALVGAAISVFAGLPGPIQTAALALLALRVGPAILGSLKSALTGIGGAAQEGATKTSLFGRAVSTVTAPVRAVVSGAAAGAAAIRQFGDEVRVQRGIVENAGAPVSRLGGAVAALGTSTVPAVAAVRSFVQQTGQIKDAAAGAGQPINTLSAAMGTLVERSAGLSAVRNAFQTASAGASRFSTVAGVAAGAATGVRLAAGGLVSALGGPWGIALAGAGILLSLLSSHQEEAAAAAREHKSAVDELAGAYKTSGGLINQDIINTNNKALADKNVANNARAAGASFDLYAAAANGNALALSEVEKASDGALRSIGDQLGVGPAVADNLVKIGREALSSGKNFSDLSEQIDKVSSGADETGTSFVQLTAAQRSQVEAIINANGALGEQIKRNQEARELYLQLAAAANKVDKATISLWDAQLQQAASAQNAATANLSYRDALDQLATAQKAVDESQKKFPADSEEVRRALRNQEVAMLNLIEAKRKDAEASSNATDAIGKQHDGYVAANKQLAELAKTYKGELPQSLQIMISKLDVASAAAAGFTVGVNEAGQAVVKLPNGKEIVITADSSSATATVTKFKNETEALKAQATVGANIDPATGAVLDWKNTTAVTVGNTTTYTNIDPATGQVRTWKAVADGTGGYTTTFTTTDPATGKVLEWKYKTDATGAITKVDANTAPADATVRSWQPPNKTISVFAKLVYNSATGVVGSTTLNANAKGNIVTATAYADGGVHKLTPMRAGLASVVKPNTWRIVGDRLRDDEFYIPDDNAPRSLALLQELARRRGFQLMQRFANGGIAGRMPSSSAAVAASTGPFELSGKLLVGGVLVDLVDARIHQANHSTGDAIRRGRRRP
ncbi:phage tail tape measure protein [Amycolatopsis sp. NPDC059657]|uniref:phage tail tape measure protein n=1 Tax=Amycolatopsis sp. NPDC059657 TaxID=3346899 RepID=UPI003672D980